jgi:hypothetical protein
MANGHRPDAHPLAGGFAGVNTSKPRTSGKPKNEAQSKAAKSVQKRGIKPKPVPGNKRKAH